MRSSVERNTEEESGKPQVFTGYSYQAAYDADEDLDVEADEDEK